MTDQNSANTLITSALSKRPIGPVALLAALTTITGYVGYVQNQTVGGDLAGTMPNPTIRSALKLPANPTQGFQITGAGPSNQPLYVDPPSLPLNSFIGIDATGATDMTTIIQIAWNVAAMLHMPLRLCGSYLISGTLSLTSSDGSANTGSGIVGCSSQGATLITNSATADMIDLVGASFGLMQQAKVANVKFLSTVPRTGGVAIKMTNCQRCVTEHVDMTGMFHGIDSYNGSLNEIKFNNFHVGTANSLQTGSQSIGLYGNDVNSYVIGNYGDNTNIVANMPTVGLGIYNNVNGEYIEANSFSHYQYGMFVSANANEKIQNLFFRQNAFDLSGLYGALFQTGSASGNLYRIFSVGDWFAATAQGPGVRFQGDGAMGAVSFDSPIIRSNATDGLDLAGNVSSGFQLNNPMITANNDQDSPNHHSGATGCAGTSTGVGINITDTRVHATIIGGKIGPTAEEFVCQTYGIVLNNGTDYHNIQGVDVAGNVTAGILQGTVGPHSRVLNNPGYNPVGIVNGVTVGSSPWTYTAGSSPETIYALAGTCSLVTQTANNQVVGVNTQCAGQYQLGPNESLQFTYSSAPVINKVIH